MLIAVFVVGTAGYVVIEADRQMTVFDAAYMTAITLSTVGFSERWELSRVAQWWTLGIIAVGIGAISVAFTSLITLFISGELRFLREQRKMDSTIRKMQGHVIVCGYGRMGVMVVSELRRRDLTVVVLEIRADAEMELRKAGVPFLIANATEEDTLDRVAAGQARSLVVTLPHDADNVYITLTARALHPSLPIIARAEQASTEAKLLRAGASHVVCPHLVGATTIANMLTRPKGVDFVEIADRGVQLEMDEYVIRTNSPLHGQTLRESKVREKSGAIVVAIKRADGEMLYSPEPGAVLASGDTLIVVGPAGISTKLDRIDAPV